MTEFSSKRYALKIMSDTKTSLNSGSLADQNRDTQKHYPVPRPQAQRHRNENSSVSGVPSVSSSGLIRRTREPSPSINGSPVDVSSIHKIENPPEDPDPIVVPNTQNRKYVGSGGRATATQNPQKSLEYKNKQTTIRLPSQPKFSTQYERLTNGENRSDGSDNLITQSGVKTSSRPTSSQFQSRSISIPSQPISSSTSPRSPPQSPRSPPQSPPSVAHHTQLPLRQPINNDSFPSPQLDHPINNESRNTNSTDQLRHENDSSSTETLSYTEFDPSRYPLIQAFKRPIYKEMTLEDQKRYRLSFTIKFTTLCTMCPKILKMPVIQGTSDLDEIHDTYDRYYQQVTVNNSVGNWRVMLIIFYLILEYVGTQFLGLGFSGLTLSELKNINEYDFLLIELGEQYSFASGAKYSPMTRLAIMMSVNAGIFVVSSLIAKHWGDPAGSMVRQLGRGVSSMVQTPGSSEEPSALIPNGGGFSIHNIIGNLGSTFMAMKNGTPAPNQQKTEEKPKRRPRRPVVK